MISGLEPPMPFAYRSTLPALCLSLLLPLAANAADAPPAAEEKPAERQALPERSQEDAAALERQVPAREQQQLQVDDETFLALWKPANSSEPLGVVIIVPGAGESADWPQAISPLRNKFPDTGWSSLSLTLPDLSSTAAQPRVVEAPPATEGSSNKGAATATAQPIEQAASAEESSDPAATTYAEEQHKADIARIDARIDAAVAYAQQQNARSIVIVGHGTGAWWAARYLSEKQPPQVQKLVMVAAQTPLNQQPDLAELTPTLKLPTADLFYQDTAQARKAALARLHASKRLKSSSFSQITLKALPGNSDAGQEQLFRRIRGWLTPQETGS